MPLSILVIMVCATGYIYQGYKLRPILKKMKRLHCEIQTFNVEIDNMVHQLEAQMAIGLPLDDLMARESRYHDLVQSFQSKIDCFEEVHAEFKPYFHRQLVFLIGLTGGVALRVLGE